MYDEVHTLSIILKKVFNSKFLVHLRPPALQVRRSANFPLLLRAGNRALTSSIHWVYQDAIHSLFRSCLRVLYLG